MQVTTTAAPIVTATPPTSDTKPKAKKATAEYSTADGTACRGAKRQAGTAGLDGNLSGSEIVYKPKKLTMTHT